MYSLIFILLGLTVCFVLGFYLFGVSSRKIAVVAGYSGLALSLLGFALHYFLHKYDVLALIGVYLLDCWVMLNVASGLADVKKRRGVFEYIFENS